MNLLITGGSGFIGSNFCNDKYNLFNKIVIIDNLNYCSNIKNIELLLNKPNVFFIKKDILDIDLIELYKLYDINLITHFAAQTHVDNSYNNITDFIKDNISATCHILESLRNFDKKIRLIHFSTDEIYGPSEDRAFTETSPFNPSNPYAASKASAEMFVNSYKLSFKLNIIIVRCNNAYGIKQYLEKVIPSFIIKALENKPLLIHGFGNQERDFIHTKDINNALMIIIKNGIDGEIYNISHHNPISILKLSKLIIQKTKSNSKIQFIKDRPFNDTRYYVDSNKLKNLGWSVKTDFFTELDHIVEWYQINKNWWVNENNDY